MIKRQRVLVLSENEDFFQLIVTKLLATTLQNFVMKKCNDINSAESISRELHIDIVILHMENDFKSKLLTLLTLCRSLSAIPVISISESSDLESTLECLQAGAQDHLSSEELSRASFQKIVYRTIERFRFRKVNLDRICELQKINKLYEEELKLAGRIQEVTMADRFFDFPDIAVAVEHHPLESGSGDFFHIIQLDPGRYLIFLTDVTGHGTPAALYTMMMRSEFNNIIHDEHSPAAICKFLNRRMHEILYTHHFATAVVVLVDTNSSTLTYANAGHPLPLYYSTTTEKVIVLENSNPLMGLMPDWEFSEDQVQFGHEDTFCIFTDGATTTAKTIITTEQTLDLIPNHPSMNIENWVQAFISNAFTRLNTSQPNDDVTVVGIRIK
ncbi:MAG: fused response regulator/phosphatase [Candidatus Lindowbacteria bacterium]|nr:fused response regulator/phosphatase [Candidatus Lindowbacteria bacterium]